MTLLELKNLFDNKEITLRSLTANIKNNEELIDELCKYTAFLDNYDNTDILERIYCFINNINELPVCKYCGKKLLWGKRMDVGYRSTCGSKECNNQYLSEIKIGKNDISNNRDSNFIEWQNTVKTINDDIIKEHINYDKYLDLITNNFILSYLDNRFSDSYSRLETLQRIRKDVFNKPLCPTCGKPVQWVGKQSKMFTKYCSNSCSANNKETVQTRKNTLKEKWGTENCYDSDLYKKMMKEKYGVEYAWQREDIKEKRKNTLIQRYGTDIVQNIPEVREKSKKTMNAHYGYDYYFQTPENRKLIIDSALANGYGTSKKEQIVQGFLDELNIKYKDHYTSDVFPYNVDFYLEDFDLYLEYHGSQYHHGKAFLNTKEDIEEANELIKKNEKYCKENNLEASQYIGIFNTWTKHDVAKRNYAQEHNINYLELYHCNTLEELSRQLNFYLCCKDRKNPYCYPDEIIWDSYERYKKLGVNELNEVQFKHNYIIKQFQGQNFYKGEMELFANDIIKRRKLIQNRVKYLNKKEEDLTVDDILTGFKKSGIYYGYSHFNPAWTNWFVNHYNIKMIYDPCGGWGHHLLGMLSCDRIIYNDLSTPVVEGINKMKEFFGITQLEVHNEDGSYYVPDNVDAWFMCPPYFNIERYESGGFETIEDYIGFLNRIFNIWFNSSARVFGFIIREDYYALLDDKYKVMLESMHSLKIATSHFIKSKKHKEYFYILHK